MSREPTWLEAASLILEKCDETWMTAPELVRSIEKAGVRSLKSDYNQAVRTLRSALNYESKKGDGSFLRKDYNFNCYFALRKFVQDKRELIIERSPAKRFILTKPTNPKRRASASSAKSHTPDQVNGYASSPSTPLSPTHSPNTPTVEIDPDFTHQQKDSSTGFCLPSPLTSLLGPRRTLNVLNESTDTSTQRPVREARKRRVTKDMENEDPLSSPVNGSTHSAVVNEILQLDFCHPLPCLCSNVDCVRSLSSLKISPLREDPCAAQGLRPSSQSIEINPNYIHKQELDSESSTETISEEEFDSIQLQRTPSSQLLIKRRRRRRKSSMVCDSGSQVENSESELAEVSSMDSPRPLVENERTGLASQKRKSRLSLSSAKNVSSVSEGRGVSSDCKSSVSVVDRVNKVSDQRRHVSTLFLPCSPLLNENLKTLLGMNAFQGLNETQKQKLVSHLPIVDQENGTSIPDDCFSNSFYSSALREWSERTALGMFTPEYKARVRGEEKRKLSVKPDNSWKEQYYERHYGDRTTLNRNSPPPFYPYTPSSPNTGLLTAIVDGYQNRESIQNEWDPPPTHLPHPAPPKVTPTPISPRPKKNPKKSTSKEINSSRLKPVKRPPESVTASRKPKPVKRLKSLPEKKSPLNSTTKKKNSTVSSLLSTKSARKSIKKKPAIKRPRTTSQTAQAIMQQLLMQHTDLPREFLTRLPAKMSYQEILQTLISASATNPDVLQINCVGYNTYTAPYEHTHSVFHDHFALLSKEHVPIDFCFRVASLPLSVPVKFYNACLRAKAVTREHSYAKCWDSPKAKSFTLSLPRSLMKSRNGCVCDGRPLVFCTVCHSLYHSNCSDTCPTCLVRQQC